MHCIIFGRLLRPWKPNCAFIRRKLESSTYKSSEKKKKLTLRKYIVSRYMQFVGQYEKVLEKRFPSALRMYQMFKIGISDFYKDLKDLLVIVKLKNSSPRGIYNLSRQQIELYYQMPKDIMKVTPVLLLSALPFTNYVIFPLMYYFPRQLLCSHFWSIEQKVNFAVHKQRQRLYNYRPVFRCLQNRLEYLEDSEYHSKWNTVLGKLGSGIHPSANEIIECKKLFMDEPYHIMHLYGNHVTALLRLHSMHVGILRRFRLAERAKIIHAMDLAILKEGGPCNLTLNELRWALFFRGLNPINMKTEDMVEWLQQWVNVSTIVCKDSYSLLLHCPVLLAYNHPTNWSLIY